MGIADSPQDPSVVTPVGVPSPVEVGSSMLLDQLNREFRMFERLTDRARKVMALANQEAQRFNHEYIGTEHILLGLVKEGSGVGANVLKNLDIDPEFPFPEAIQAAASAPSLA